MAIWQSFDPDTPEIITPAQIVAGRGALPEALVITFQARTYAAFLRQYDTTPLTDLHLEETVDSPIYSGMTRQFTYAGRTLAGCLSPVGAPGAVAVMEQAIALGVRRFVAFGTCGALVPGLADGQLIVPSAAYRDEGTSYHYAPAGDYITLPTAEKTAAILGELGVPHTVGRVWTTDAFFRETQANLAKRVAEGCVAVDMEVSALAAVAQFRGVSLHSFLYAADSLSDKGWDPRTLGTLPAEPRARYWQLAAELAARVCV
ncbi:MAG: nucleoside phosphorylase [Propionibacteriaceae bacterium]|nr:nucleoside phosphorylase [Propionibacteriaceae bacterium]